MRAADAQPVEQTGGVGRQLVHRREPYRRSGPPGAAVVVDDALEALLVERQHGPEDLGTDREAGDPQQRRAGAVVLVVQPHAVDVAEHAPG